jgi:hypothetical protein
MEYARCSKWVDERFYTPAFNRSQYATIQHLRDQSGLKLSTWNVHNLYLPLGEAHFEIVHPAIDSL